MTILLIKHWSICLLGYPMNKTVAVLNTLCSIAAVSCFVLFRFYFLERYQLYGCRRNYRHGFPAMCPSDSLGVDSDSMISLAMGFVAALVGRIATVLSLHPHWQCRIALDTKHRLEKNDVYSAKLFALLCRLQGISPDCGECKKEWKKKFTHTVEYLSCVPVELYLSHKLKKHCRFAGIVVLLVLAVLVPLATLVTERQAVQVVLALLMFLCFPMVALGMLLVSVPFLSTTRDLVFLSLLGTWLLVFSTCLLVGWCTEHRDEKTLERKLFGERLMRLGLRREDAHVCHSVLHRKLTQKEKTLLNDLQRRFVG